MTVPVKSPKKLIEVALPLDAINEAAAREKSIRHGHPSTLHLWWARRPLAAARAVIFAQMVNDPGYQQGGGFRYGVNKEKARKERERLFDIIKKLVKWENTSNEVVLEQARAEIRRSWRETCELNKDHPDAKHLFDPDKLPAFHDPFAGGGAIPLEAQRLGLESYASDLNPVAVMINKAMIEIPSRFAGHKPVGPVPTGYSSGRVGDAWHGAEGLAEDVRRYGTWMCEEAKKRIGHLYPQVEVTREIAKDRPDLKDLVGKKLTVIAWLWARTVKSPNPAFSDVEMPLASTFVLSSKKGKEAYVEPVIEGRGYRFTVKAGVPTAKAKSGTSAGKRAAFLCLLSGSPIDYNYIREEGKAGRMKQRLMAIVAEGSRGRIYLSPSEEHVDVAERVKPTWIQKVDLQGKCRVNVSNYGFDAYGDLFTPRQLVALTTFSDLVGEAIEKCRNDAVAAGSSDDGQLLDAGGKSATAYAQAVGVYLSFAIDKGANYWSSLCSWHSGRDTVTSTFGRQAIPMVWDYAEANPLSDSSGCVMNGFEQAAKVLINVSPMVPGHTVQADAQTQAFSKDKVISTDPPYYDNIGYADLSDFFYIWLRRSLKSIFPKLFATVAAPKAEELVATPYRHDGKEKAEAFFLNGMTKALHNLTTLSHPAFPVSVYYAFKQSETTDTATTTNAGWDTFLEAVIRSGFSIHGTWPMRTELTGNLKKNFNALASSIVLVCRKRLPDAPIIGRREFLRELNARLPEALEEMTRGGEHSPVAPVDLSQAVIGPGMAIFSQYAAVLEADGSPMSVRTALQLIYRFIAEDDFDVDTRFCLAWFAENHWDAGKFGQADVLARSKGTSVDGLRDADVIHSAAGQVRLLRPDELPADWDPTTDNRLPIWEGLHHLIRALRIGEDAAGRLLADMPSQADAIRALAYRLYTLCEQQNLAEDARSYNELVTSWSGIEQVAAKIGYSNQPGTLFK